MEPSDPRAYENEVRQVAASGDVQRIMTFVAQRLETAQSPRERAMLRNARVIALLDAAEADDVRREALLQCALEDTELAMREELDGSTIVLHADVLAASGRYVEALKHLKAFMDATVASGGQVPERFERSFAQIKRTYQESLRSMQGRPPGAQRAAASAAASAAAGDRKSVV